MQSRRRLTRRQRRRMKRKLQEAAGITVAGLALGGLLIAGLTLAPYDPPPAPEHYGQIKYCGVWWDVDDYEKMMAERDEYIKAEQAEDAAIADAIRQAQERQASGSAQTLIKSKDWGADDAYMLANIAMAEAEGEDTEGKALVILVVLNRVWSDGFPDTIEEVITQSRQFTAYENGRYDRVEPSEDCYRALELVEQGWDESQGAMYFERTSTESTWHNTTLKKLFTHGNHTFYIEEGK